MREAVALRRILAASRPDAFTPDLATSLTVWSNCADAMGQTDAGLARNLEAIGMLTERFVRLPGAFASLMGAMVRDYRGRCESLGCEPDATLLAPITEVFERLEEQRESNE